MRVSTVIVSVRMYLLASELFKRTRVDCKLGNETTSNETNAANVPVPIMLFAYPIRTGRVECVELDMVRNRIVTVREQRSSTTTKLHE